MLMRWIACLSLLGVCSPLLAQEAAQPTAAAPAQQLLPAPKIAPEEAIVEALDGILRGYRFNKRLLTNDEQDHLLLFSRGTNETALVGWTTSRQPNRVALAPASPMQFNAFSYSGERLGTVNTIGIEIGLVLTTEPRILLPQQPNGYLQVAAAAQTVNSVVRVRGPQTVELTCEFVNPLGEVVVMPVPDMGKTVAVKPGGNMTVSKSVMVGRSSEPVRTSIGAMGIRQPVTIIVENPLEMNVRAEEPRVLVVDMVNGGGEAFKGELLLRLGESRDAFRFPVEFRSGQRLNSLRVPIGADLPLPAPLTVMVEQTIGQPLRTTYILARTGALQFVPAADFSRTGERQAPADYALEAEGGASAMLRGGIPPQTPVPWPERGALGVVYDLGSRAPRQDAGPALLSVVPTNPAYKQIIGQPSQVGFWLHGDGNGNLLSLSWVDARGRTHVSRPQPVDWKGWRYITFDVPQNLPLPLQWGSLMRIEPAPGGVLTTRHGALLANGYCLIYGDNYSQSDYVEERGSYVEEIAPAAPTEVLEPEIRRGEPVRITPRGSRR